MQDDRTMLKTGRIEALSDGIFAIAMTILILSFETMLQQPARLDEKDVMNMLFELWPDFFHYVISFVILGVFWFQHHHQFHYIKSVDVMLLFINIAGLMFIGLIPFTTAMVSDYSHTRAAAIVFEMNLFIAGLIFFLHWIYASHRHCLVDGRLEPGVIRFYRMRNLVIPGVSVCAMLLSLYRPRLGTMLYFLVPFILLLWKKEQAG